MEQPRINTSQEHAPRDLLALMRSVESTPPGDLEWAMHCTRQQALLLRLNLPGGNLQDLDQLGAALGIEIAQNEQSEDAVLLFDEEHRVILVNAALPNAEQLHAAAREIKRLIDLPARIDRARNDWDFTDEDNTHLAVAFADMVLASGPEDVR